MKYLFLFCLIALWPRLAAAQSYVNPDTIYQSGDIYLQNTDVYYNPFAPPGDTDTRANLCNESDLLRDPNGVGNYWRSYLPVIYDNSVDSFVYLQNWAPHGTALGPNVVWQRLFTAKRKADGTPSNIIVGSNVAKPDTIIHPDLDGYPGDTEIVTPGIGPVIISKNEDVDFRASGRIILKSGFHVKPGAFFHAYTEPKFDSTVFSDEFDDTAKFHNQWFVAVGNGDDYSPTGADCPSDSNVRFVTDSDAHDGKALDVILREVPDTCSCLGTSRSLTNNCMPVIIPHDTERYIFSSAVLRTCPFPFVLSDSPLVPAYQHSPFGKIEIRDKIPHTQHHTNNWGGGAFEWDINETVNSNMSQICPNIDIVSHGPLNGVFGRGVVSVGDTEAAFRCPAAHWSSVNFPTEIIVNTFDYPVYFYTTPTDTFVTSTQGGYSFPSSYASSTDSFSFYYRRQPNNTTDSLTWNVSTDGGGNWRLFSAPYRVLAPGDSLWFSKDYQPTSITLTTGFGPPKTLNCRWDAHYNSIVFANPDGSKDSLLTLTGDLDSNTESYTYTVKEGGIYNPLPLIPFNGDDTTGGYQYHTFAMEILPHEVRFLVDSMVVRRIPDRLVPRSSRYSDIASQIPRSPINIHPAEIDMDYDSYKDSLGTHVDSLGIHPGSIAYYERQYFEQHDSAYVGHPANPGFWDVMIGGKNYHAAHHLVDYVKVWDVPADVKISGYPH